MLRLGKAQIAERPDGEVYLLESDLLTPVTIRSDATASDALKVDRLCDNILRDIGSIHRRVAAEGAMSPALLQLRKAVREIQDAMHDAHPDAFFR